MGVLRWPYRLDDVNLSGGNVRERGKIFHGNFNLLTEYPDNVAGTTALYKDFTDAQGWAVSGCTLSYSNGKMIVTSTGTAPFIYIAVTAEKTVRVKTKILTGDATSSRIANTTGTIYEDTKTYDGTDFHNLYIGAGATGLLRVYPGFNGVVSGDTFEIDFIYIGDGTYSSLALDASGNGNHGSVFGATPVAGITGRVLSFDGVNDYFTIHNTFGSIFNCNFRIMVTTNAECYFLDQVDASATFSLRRVVSTDDARFVYYNGTGVDSTNFTGVFTGLDGLYTNIGLEVDFLSATAKLFVNGTLFETKNLTTPVAPTSSIMYFMKRAATLTFFAGTIDDPRIYDRALSAEEVLELYQNPGIYNPLSEYPLQDGFSEMPQEGIIRSPTDIGPSKTRQRFTALATYFTAQYDADNNQRQVLDHFYRSVTRGGSLAFEYPHPDGYNVDARFAGPPQYTPNNQEYTASVALEVLP